MLTFSPGNNRIFYKATSFAEDKTVTGKIVLLDLSVTSALPFTNVGDGLYTLDYTFARVGRYAITISEDGAIKTWSTIRIGGPNA